MSQREQRPGKGSGNASPTKPLLETIISRALPRFIILTLMPETGSRSRQESRRRNSREKIIVKVSPKTTQSKRKKQPPSLATLQTKVLPDGRKRLRGQLPERKDSRKQVYNGKKLDDMGHLAGTIAHELRQPLSAIQNIVSYLKVTVSTRDGVVTKNLNMLEQQVVMAGEILSNMLLFARSGKPRIEPTDLHAVLKNVLSRSALRPSLHPRIRLKRNLARRLPPVLADPVHVDRILSNLIANGVESMERKEKTDARGTLSVATETEGRQVVVRVADTGRGISPAQARKIFEPFFTTKRTGTGLGLALCRRMAEANGGSILFQSLPGKRTVFELRLPRA